MKKTAHILVVLFMFVALIAAAGCSSSSGGGGTTAAGQNSVVVAQSAAPVSVCPTGGIQVDAGIDTNSNGVLDAAEVTSTQYVCNGDTGANGNNGANGTNGTDGTNGTNGTNGNNGTNGTSAGVSITAEPAGANCANGGSKISVGPDANNDGAPDTVTSVAYICNGTDLTAAPANEQCLICHGPGTVEAIAVVHTTSPLSATTSPLTVDGTNVDINEQSAAQLAGLNMVGTIDVVTIATVTPVVNFTVKDSAGHGIIGLNNTQFAYAIARLRPATATNAEYWESYMVTSATSRPGSDSEVANNAGLVDNGNGTYTYTFNKNLDTVPGIASFATTSNLTHRMVIQISGTVSGGSLNDRAINIVQDFVPTNLPAFTGTTTHNIVTADACNTCHYKIGTTTPHGGRVDTKYCVVCHTYQRGNGRSTSAPDSTGAMTGSTYLVVGQVDVASETTSSAGGFTTGEFVSLVHKIHMGEGQNTHGTVQGLKLTGWNYGGVLFNEVTYPQDARNCVKCHLGTQADNWKNNPSRKACGSCHDNVSFATVVPTGFVAHSGGAYTVDSGCGVCHPASGGLAGIADKHVPVINPDPADPRLGGTNTHTNGSYVAAAGAVPTGAAKITYVISSVTTTANKPSIKFALVSSLSGTMVFSAPTSTTSELMPNFAGSPSVYFVWAEPQDGITAPSDFNKSASVYIKSAWNGSLSSTATMTGPDASGFYTIVRTATTITSTAVMLTGGVGYTYGSGSPELVQTNLAAYPYNLTNLSGGLAVPPPNVWKVATGYTGRRVAVDTAKCNECHAALGVAPTFHDGQRNDAPTCSFCHNPNRTSSGWSANASTFVHAIHGASKRTVPFTWASSSETDNFSKITYPDLLNNCLACHVSGYYDFSNATSAAQEPNRLFETVATGTMASSSTTSFAFSPYITQDVNYGTAGAADNLVSSPTAGVCFACHDTTAARSHMELMGAAIYQKRSTAIQP